VQSVIPMPGFGAMRLTTARYYTPSGVSIQAKGITPDIEVELARIETVDTGIGREEDLRGALDSSDNSSDEDNAEAFDQSKVDYQLARAIDLLRGMRVFGQMAQN